MGSPWLIGAGLLGVGLIGYWLMGSKKSPTQPPDSMPSLNTAVRGKTIQVTFGSNRVYPQIVWTNNFKAVRQQSSGKMGSKGGGSGGFGSAKGGGNAGTGYLYYWDMMFNFGQIDQPATIRRGWIGSDQIRQDVLDLISSGTSSTALTLLPFFNADTTTKTATLQFTESFLYPGYVTDDPLIESWDYFETVTGYDCTFPSTFGLGFEGLELGQAPTVPQLSLETVPSHIDVNFVDGKFISAMDSPSPQNNSYTSPFCKDTAGNFYNLLTTTAAGAGLAAWRLDTGTSNTLSLATMNANIQSITEFAGISIGFCIPLAIDGTEFFYVYSNPQQMTGGSGYMIQCYRIETDGSFTFMNAALYQEDFSLGGNCGETVFATGMTINGEMIIVTNANTFVSSNPGHLLVIHDLSFFKTTLIRPVWNAAAGQRHMITTFGGFDLLNDPFWNGKVGLIKDASQIVIYYGPTDMDTAPAGTYAASIASIFPDGVFVVADLFSDNAGVLTWTLIGPDLNFIKDQSGNNVIPYSDVDHSGDGDYSAPQQYGSFITMTRGFASDHFRAGVRACYVDPAGFNIIEVGSGAAHFFTSADHSALNPLGDPHAQVANGELVITARVSGGFGTYVNGTFGGFPPQDATDVTPPYIIYRILTSEFWGFATKALFGYSVTTDRIDTATYDDAVAYCEAQGIKVSITYKDQGNLLSILNELVELYQGFLVDQDGKIYFGLVKGQYDTPPRVIDNAHFVVDQGKPPVNVLKAALEDGFNQVKYNFLDRSIAYAQNQVVAEDPVDIDINGPRSKTYDAKFVMPGSVAQLIANRALLSNLYGKDSYSFSLGRKDADLKIGDPIFLVDSYDPILNSGVYALITDWQPKSRERADITAVREFPHIATASAAYTSVASIDPGFSTLIDTIAPMLLQKAYELPREYQGAKASLYFGYAQQSKIMGAQLYLSTGGDNYVLTQDAQPYLLSGRMATPLENRHRGYVEQGLEFYLFPRSDFTVSTPTFFQNYDLDDVTQAIRASGAGVIICGSEPIAIQNLTLLGQNHYRAKYGFRGWGGGPISAHSSGELFSTHGAGIFVHEISQDDVGRDISYKIVPYNFAGKTYDVSSIVANSYTILGMFWRPREMPHTRIYVDSAISIPASQSIRGPFIGVTSGGCGFNMTWRLHDNQEGFGAGGYGAGGYGHFIMSDSVGWRVDVMSKNGTAVSSFIVNTPFFRYTSDQNSTDFNGFGHDLVLKTTAFTIKGDAPTVDIRSLSINW